MEKIYILTHSIYFRKELDCTDIEKVYGSKELAEQDFNRMMEKMKQKEGVIVTKHEGVNAFKVTNLRSVRTDVFVVEKYNVINA